jgi:regulatory protein YycI of two-component signal transduction system YycFG
MEEESVQSWNKKRIFIAVFLLVLLLTGGYFFKTRILGEAQLQPSKSVEGISTKDESAELPEIDIQKAMKEKIGSLKQQVAGLNVSDIASSSPQVQKILNDIKSLQEYPGNQMKEICNSICSRL